jgi:hypothetical protein
MREFGTKFFCWTVLRTLGVTSDDKLACHYHRLNQSLKAAAGDAGVQRAIFATHREVTKELWKRGLYPPREQARS